MALKYLAFYRETPRRGKQFGMGAAYGLPSPEEMGIIKNNLIITVYDDRYIDPMTLMNLDGDKVTLDLERARMRAPELFNHTEESKLTIDTDEYTMVSPVWGKLEEEYPGGNFQDAAKIFGAYDGDGGTPEKFSLEVFILIDGQRLPEYIAVKPA